MTGVQIVGPLAETIIELTSGEAHMLANAASSAAHALDDPRYNGHWDAQTKDQLYALDHGEDTTRHMDAWVAEKAHRDDNQQRLRAIAHLLDPHTYDEEGKHRG